MNSLLPYAFIDKIKALECVESVVLFGSRARGDNRSRSDIDLAVKLREATGDNWQKVLDIIESADTLLEIDCVNYHTADEALKARIDKQGKIV